MSDHALSFKSHPPGLPFLFFAEMWERFSFYGMRALLILYMTSKLGFDDKSGIETYAAYMTLVYTTLFPGGFVSDRFLGNRKAIVWGGWIIASGHLLLAIPDSMGAFYLGLAAIAIGTGLFKSNISTMLGQLYGPGDTRRDAGFTLFYVGINTGALLSPLLCGYIGQTYGWHYGFGIASIGMLAGVVTFMRGYDHLEGKGLAPVDLQRPVLLGLSLERALLGLFLCAILGVAGLLANPHVLDSFLPMVGIGGCGFLVYHALTGSPSDRRGLFTILVLMVFHTAFFALFEQAGTSLSLFTDRNVERNLWGFEIPSSLFQSLNPFFVITLGLVFSVLWTKLAAVGREPSTPLKFVLSLLQVGLGFLVLKLGVYLARETGLTNMSWLVIAYLLHTTAELCISPIGLSMVTKLSPPKILSSVMGIWFISTAFAEYCAGLFAKLSALPEVAGEGALDLVQSAEIYGNGFVIISKFAFVMAVILMLLVPWLKRTFVEHRI